MKLLIRDKITVAVLILASVCFLLICATLNFSAEDQSRIPIGLANLDLEEIQGEEVATKVSQELVDHVLKSSTFRVVLGEVDTLIEAMDNGEIDVLYVINRGYQKRINNGSSTRLITVYKSAQNESAALLSDIFAGEMMDQVCLKKSLLTYQKLDFDGYKQLETVEYIDYLKQMIDEDEFKFSFNVKLVDIKVASPANNYEKLENSVIYRQIVAGIFAMLLSFAVLFSFTYVCMEKEQGILRRKQLALSNKVAELIGTLSAVVVTTGILCLIFVSCICYYAKVNGAFWPLLLLSIQYVCFMAVIFMLLVKVTSGVLSYQMIGAVMILIFGLLGFVTMVNGIVFKDFISVLENNPNGWFIREFVDIIVNTY